MMSGSLTTAHRLGYWRAGRSVTRHPGRCLADEVPEARHRVDQAVALEDAHGLADRLAGMAMLPAQDRDRRDPVAPSGFPAGDLLPDERRKPHVGPRVWLGGYRHVRDRTRWVSKVVDY